LRVMMLPGSTISKLCKLGLRAGSVLVLAGIMAFTHSAPNAPGTTAPTGPGAEEIITFLNQTIVWSRQLSTQQQLVTEPSDALFLNDSRQLADQIVKLSFDFARARAQALASQSAGGNTGASPALSSRCKR
jgi:hypothetical protein